MDQPLSVICDQCRATGVTGVAPFTALADVLSFTPVPRRPHANGWDAERQRGFIAALVATGSPRRAAAALGKHAFGAEQLRRARGGASFSAAWDAALDLARERELAAMRDGLDELAAEAEAEAHRRRNVFVGREQRAAAFAGPSPSSARTARAYDAAIADAEHAEDLADAQERIAMRITGARRLYLALIAGDAKMRRAWETLVGKTDWTAARAGLRQPYENPDEPANIRDPALLIPAEAGFLAEFTGGPDALEPLRQAIAAIEDHSGEPAPALDPEAAAYRDALLAAGWTEDEQGDLWSPEAPSAGAPSAGE